MKFNTQGLALVIVFQLMIAGATLSITATNAGAGATCNDPEKADDKIIIGFTNQFDGEPYKSIAAPSSVHDYDYLTTGETTELDFSNECKNYTKFRKIFRENIKTTHDYCSGMGEVCEYTGSAGCGTRTYSPGLICECEIEFTYCTQTSLGKKLDPSLKSRGKNEF